MMGMLGGCLTSKHSTHREAGGRPFVFPMTLKKSQQQLGSLAVSVGGSRRSSRPSARSCDDIKKKFQRHTRSRKSNHPERNGRRLSNGHQRELAALVHSEPTQQ